MVRHSWPIVLASKMLTRENLEEITKMVSDKLHVLKSNPFNARLADSWEFIYFKVMHFLGSVRDTKGEVNYY